MRTIQWQQIVDAVKKLCIEAATNLSNDIIEALQQAKQREQAPLARSILDVCLQNAAIAAEKKIPICQDTGFAVFFIEIGNGVRIEGGTLETAVNEGTRQGYKAGFLRKSIVSDPLFDRINTNDNTPAIIHLSTSHSDTLSITLAPKGAGSENMSALAMLKPSDGVKGVEEFIYNTVIRSGGNACPPLVVGVGIGGTFEAAAILSKKALLRPVGCFNADPRYAALEKRLYQKINASGLGPQGLGGCTTALCVNVEFMPCHIATLAVAVALNCHAARHATVIL